MKITLKDIAEKANVSVTTVSLVLNDRPCRISLEKKKLIKQIAEEYNYSANQIARSLVTKETKMLGLILPDIGNIFFSSLAKNLEEVCRKEGYTLIISNTNDQYEQDLKLLHFLHNRSVDGIFIIPSNESYKNNRQLLEQLEKLTIPYVMLDRVFSEHACDKVIFDNEKGAYLAVKYLIEKGHRKIGCIASSFSSINGKYRLQGYKKAMDENNCEIVSDYIVEGNYRLESGYNAGKKLLSSKITAVFVMNDMMSLGFLKLLNERNEKVPQDISLVSYDNTINPYLIGLELTSVEQNVKDLTQAGLHLLLSRIKDPKKTHKEICLTPKLIEKNSVREIN
ncbi:HTH-type transcriptional repressor PurR [Paraliobacillus sp. PM-2]|uniref:LacI family DNA-binding transcriptional regulator n=1 Tax=Paraliobacillus sp. PM-2 TaxID=1462524 RepID=UPI00061C68EA|nr:LacI family DNA-binding transcriptional regulator [Paraliobacillus sp. PM-2]CQR48147.1 HTH-type transcriptional repressor PurR [Paraliobacillus sp. PM-2]